MEVWARDPGRVRRGKLTVTEARCVLRETGVGAWSLTVDETARWSPRLQEGWGIVLVDGGQVLFSGPATSIGTTQQDTTRDVEVSGVTDMVALADRYVHPDPALPGDQQTTTASWARKGTAEALIADLVNLNAGPSALADRRVAGLAAITSQGRGAMTSVAARFTTLLEEVRALATVGGLVVDVVQEGTSLVPVVRVPVDRSRSVRFQPRSGLASYDMALTAPTVTHVLVAGQGTGTARTMRAYSQATTWGRRIETFQDRRDTNDIDELAKAGAETLTEGAAGAASTFTVAETPLQRFGQHYRLGDTVTVALPGGGEIVDGVRAVDIAWTPHGRTVEPTVGVPGTEPVKTPTGVQRINGLLRQVRRLEAAQ